MPQLTLNNWAIPVAEAKGGVISIGSTSRAYSGVLRQVHIATKREWSITTSPMPYVDAAALEGLLLARGEYWPGQSDAFSSKGLGTRTNNGVQATPGKFGNGFWPRVGTVNLFTGNVRTGGDTTANTAGFFPMLLNNGYDGMQVDATLSLSSSQKMQGTYSIYVDCSNSNGQWYSGCCAQASVSPNTQYTFSCYTRGDNLGSGIDITTMVWGNNDGVTINSRANGINSTTSWERWTCTFTTGTTCNAVRCIIGERSNGGDNFWTDAWQLEAGGLASPWTDEPSLPTNLSYSVARELELGVDAVTFCAWTQRPNIGGTLAALYPPAGGPALLRLYYSGTQTLTASVNNEINQPVTVSGAWTTPESLAHLALVAYQAPAKGPNVLIFVDGILSASIRAPLMPSLKTLTAFSVGNNNGSNPWGSRGVVDEVNFYPFAASPGMLRALATASTAQGQYPMLAAAGSLIHGDAPIAVLGSDVKTQLTQGRDATGVWHNNLSVVEFALSEV